MNLKHWLNWFDAVGMCYIAFGWDGVDMLSSKPYWDVPLKNTFQVTVQDVEKHDSEYWVRIDKDVIRPEGGGQAG